MFAGYVDQLLDILFNDAIHDPVGFKELSDNIVLPPDLCAAYERPVKSEAERLLVRRFNIMPVED